MLKSLDARASSAFVDEFRKGKALVNVLKGVQSLNPTTMNVPMSDIWCLDVSDREEHERIEVKDDLE